MTPVTWPVGRTPTSGLPSTSVALISIGALAAMASWLQREVLVACAWPGPRAPGRASDVPVSLRNAQRRCAAPAGSGCTRGERSRWSTSVGADHPLRRAVERGRDHRVEHRRRGVAVLHVVGHVALLGEQEAGAHGDAVGAVGQRGDEAAAVVEAAGAEHRDLARRPRRPPAGSSSDVGTVPVWPPPSPPWAITASTPHLEHLLGVAAGADGRHDEDAGVVAAGRRRPWSGAPAKRHEPHALADDERDALVEVGLVGPEVDAERRVGALLHARGRRRAAARRSS